MKINFRRFFYTGLFLLFFFSYPSYSAMILNSVSQHELSVGDQVYFTVSAIVPKGATVIPPEPSENFGSLTVKGWNNKKYPLEKADSITFEYVVTTYKAEPCTIPALSYLLENGTEHDTLITKPIPLTVIPLVVSDSADIKDLKPQLVTGQAPRIWLWLLFALGASAALLLLWSYLKKIFK